LEPPSAAASGGIAQMPGDISMIYDVDKEQA
jgi:hypothetical protein